MTPQFGEKIGPVLRAIVVDNGRSVMRDRGRLQHMLKDDCPGADREIDAILSAVDEGIPQAMLGSVEFTEAQAAEMARRLESRRGLARDQAEWTVKTWAFALERKTTTGPAAFEAPKAPPAAPAKRQAMRWWRTAWVSFAILLAVYLAAGFTLLGLHKRNALDETWQGAADVQVCGQSAGARQVKLDTFDARIPWDGESVPAEGILSIDSNQAGMVPFEIRNSRIAAQTSPARGLYIEAEGAPYSLDLGPGDRWAGIGAYRSLTGTLKRPNSACSDRGVEGEVLTVSLKRKE